MTAHSEATWKPDIIVADAATAVARLLQIANAHHSRDGVMCVECGYLWPCPTRRMADGSQVEGEGWYHAAASVPEDASEYSRHGQSDDSDGE